MICAQTNVSAADVTVTLTYDVGGAFNVDDTSVVWGPVAADFDLAALQSAGSGPTLSSKGGRRGTASVQACSLPPARARLLLRFCRARLGRVL